MHSAAAGLGDGLGWARHEFRRAAAESNHFLGVHQSTPPNRPREESPLPRNHGGGAAVRLAAHYSCGGRSSAQRPGRPSQSFLRARRSSLS